MEIETRIIDTIRRNRISTTEVADCLDKSGVIEGVHALNRGHFRVGRVFWAYGYNQSNWECHEQLPGAQEGDVVICESFDCGNRALFGSLVAKYLMLYRQTSAIVVQGLLRDAPHLIKENWPIWCSGVTPLGCFNHKNGTAFDPALERGRREQFQGSIAVCDDSGVVVIPHERQDEAFLERLMFVEEQEDIWFDCIDRRKWNTFETVCLKKYLHEGAK